MTPELQAVATAVGQFGLGGVFLLMWWRSEKRRDEERDGHQVREDKIQADYHEAQDAHRREIIALLTDASPASQINRS